MVLTFALFGAVFSSLIWLAYAVRFISESLGDMSFFDAGLLNVLLYTLFVCLPEFTIWMIFGFISQHLSSKFIGRQMYKLFSQMKKNQEYSDLLARIMLETGENIRNSFMMNHFELLIADMNELLCEIVQRENLLTKEQASQLWVKVQNGCKWAFGKVVVENYNQNSDFKRKVLNDAKSDNILSGTIMEFCARYQALVGLLEKYDKEKTFLNIIETGVFGKVFSVFASISDELRRTREVAVMEKSVESKSEVSVQPEKEEKSSSGLFAKFSTYKKDLPKIRNEKKDEFSLALERSFSPQPEIQEIEEIKSVVHKEPVFTEKPEDKNIEPEELPDSQKALNELRREWQEIEKKQEDTDDSLAYPFGGWTDADKYQK